MVEDKFQLNHKYSKNSSTKMRERDGTISRSSDIKTVKLNDRIDAIRTDNRSTKYAIESK